MQKQIKKNTFITLKTRTKMDTEKKASHSPVNKKEKEKKTLSPLKIEIQQKSCKENTLSTNLQK